MLLKSIQGRASPAAVPERAGPQHIVTLKVTPSTHQQQKMEAAAPKPLLKPPSAPAPGLPRQNLGLQHVTTKWSLEC